MSLESSYVKLSEREYTEFMDDLKRWKNTTQDALKFLKECHNSTKMNNNEIRLEIERHKEKDEKEEVIKEIELCLQTHVKLSNFNHYECFSQTKVNDDTITLSDGRVFKIGLVPK